MNRAKSISLVKVGPVTVATFEPVSLADDSVWQEALMRMREFVDGSEAPHLLLDWHWVDQVTAGVVLDLEALVNAIDAGGGSLRLCGLPERLRAAFEPALLDRLDVGESVLDALPRYVRELRDQAEANTGDSGCRILQNST